MAKRDRQPPRVSYDSLIKAALKRHYPALAGWLLGERPEEVSALDPALATASTRISDKLLDIRFLNRPPVLLHVEFQLEGDPEMPERMAQYAVMIMSLVKAPEHHGKKLASVVVYLDREVYREDPGGLELLGDLGFRLSFTYRVIKLWEMDPGSILAAESPGLWPFVPLMAGNPTDLLVKSKNKILDAPDSTASPEAKLELLAILSGLASRVIEDQGLLEALKTEIRKMTHNKNYVFDSLIDEGRVLGLEEGLQQGRQEGARDEAQRVILRVLVRRFGPVGQELVLRLESIKELTVLEDLVAEAAVAPSIEAFLKLLPAPQA